MITVAYLKIPTEIWGVLVKIKLTGSDRQVLDAILKKTFGFGKDEDSISIGQLEGMTGLSRRQVIYCLQNLEAKRMIAIKRKRGRGIKNQPNRISLEKNPSKWVVQGKSPQYRKALTDRKKHYKKSKRSVVQESVSSANTDNIKVLTDLIVMGSANKIRFLAPTINNIYIKDTLDDDDIDISRENRENNILQDIEEPRIPTYEDLDSEGAEVQ